VTCAVAGVAAGVAGISVFAAVMLSSLQLSA